MRVDGWEERLADVIEATAPFAWGTHDCCTFAASCVDAMTGSDYVAQLAAQYTDEASAKAFIVQQGSLEAAVSSFLGPSVPGWAAARRGDVCLVPTEQGDGLGVCTGPYIAVAAERGRVLYRLTTALAVWPIE